MRSYLFFRLYGPFASWGDVAVGEVRNTHTHPSKAAILGLLASALGWPRTESQAIVRLEQDYACAMQINAAGSLMRDFHTAQIPAKKAHWGLQTRRDELVWPRSEDLDTRLTYRDYLCDSLVTVALWERQQAQAETSILHLAQSLQHPKFTLFLGRKSCVPALPLSPQVIEAADLRLAFSALRWPDFPAFSDAKTFTPSAHMRLYLEESPESQGFDGGYQQQTMRWDRVVDPSKRLFAQRFEWMLTIPVPPQEGGDACS